jgi:hypothetical protein
MVVDELHALPGRFIFFMIEKVFSVALVVLLTPGSLFLSHSYILL